jgi:hypothetical protein
MGLFSNSKLRVINKWIENYLWQGYLHHGEVTLLSLMNRIHWHTDVLKANCRFLIEKSNFIVMNTKSNGANWNHFLKSYITTVPYENTRWSVSEIIFTIVCQAMIIWKLGKYHLAVHKSFVLMSLNTLHHNCTFHLRYSDRLLPHYSKIQCIQSLTWCINMIQWLMFCVQTIWYLYSLCTMYNYIGVTSKNISS